MARDTRKTLKRENEKRKVLEEFHNKATTIEYFTFIFLYIYIF